MTKSKIKKSWENDRSDIHSPEGIEDLKNSLKNSLKNFYCGIAEAMWRYEGFEDDEKFKDLVDMSRDTVPEKFLLRNGECVQFKMGDKLHILPLVFQGGVNIYGQMNEWSPVPVGYQESARATYSAEITKIRDMKLNLENSVIWRNNRFGQGDWPIIDNMVNLLVDNMLTVNQLQLIARAPFVFNVSEDNLLSAKNFFLDICNFRPAIYINSLGEKPTPVVELVNSKIDPALFEIYDRWECNLLENLGFPCVPITKRAQQTVSEVQSNDDKIFIRRQEKLHQRERACERSNQIFGTHLKVVSVIDEQNQKAAEMLEGVQDRMNGGDDDDVSV